MNFRKSDVVQWVTIGTLIGLLYAGFAKSEPWDQCVTDMAFVKPRTIAHEVDLAVLVERLNSIDKHIASIDKKMP